MRNVIAVFCDCFFVLLACLGLWFTGVSLCAFLRGRIRPAPQKQLRFAVLVAARNEESCIAGIVESIRRQHYPPELTDIYVIPNNCTDRTAQVAARAGADILTVSPSVCSKGQALHEAFARLLREETHDAYCVFDADNEADPEFLAEMNRTLSGARAAKSRILAKNAHEGWVCAAYETWFCTANRFLNRARENIGLSARLIGTGFGVRRELLEELGGWNTRTLTEDAEFYAILAARGERIAFAEQAVTYDEEPLTFRDSMVQRRRWMSGILAVSRLHLAALLRGLTQRGRWLALDALLQFSFTCLQAWIIPVFLLQLWAEPTALAALPLAAARYYLSALLLGGLSLALEGRLTGHTIRALLLYPAFVFSFLCLQSWSLVRPSRRWAPIRHTGVRLSSSPRK